VAPLAVSSGLSGARSGGGKTGNNSQRNTRRQAMRAQQNLAKIPARDCDSSSPCFGWAADGQGNDRLDELEHFSSNTQKKGPASGNRTSTAGLKWREPAAGLEATRGGGPTCRPVAGARRRPGPEVPRTAASAARRCTARTGTGRKPPAPTPAAVRSAASPSSTFATVPSSALRHWCPAADKSNP